MQFFVQFFSSLQGFGHVGCVSFKLLVCMFVSYKSSPGQVAFSALGQAALGPGRIEISPAQLKQKTMGSWPPLDFPLTL